ncbi:hypothetical protein ACFRAE_14545 [Sphingobacterium sp. HJSM2_6]|uniref:hypothetical protein n=1 Tax=Sphingobacterium sp. HJSM2_6 TaxID=3366264 RepID=UPI003BC60B43
MKSTKPIIILIMLLGWAYNGFSQTKIQGVLIDSAYNNTLESGTISIFEVGKTSVDKVTLTDRYGKFIIENLGVGKPYILELSLQGFEKVRREFQLKANEEKDFGNINMKQVSNEIEAIDLKPPVRMNGDTIEFNADAFELDSNAVVEDLLNKLPGMVVWGDGEVTYNGRPIPTILVNGKPFFGSDKAIVIQNIDKKAVDKLQVYDRRSQEEKDKDPEAKKMEMNVVLKEGKEYMYFGSLAAGIGNKDRYAGHMNMNASNKKSQITAAYSVNNVNKDLYNIDQLLTNTTFKGIGINASFDSDFLRQGLLQQHVIGARYQYDLEGTNNTYNRNIIQGNITARWNNDLETDESYTQLVNLDNNYDNNRMVKSLTEGVWKIQNGNFVFRNGKNQNNQDKGKRALSSNVNLIMERAENDRQSNQFTQFDYLNNQSTNNVLNNDFSENQNLHYNINLNLSNKSGEYSIDGKSNMNFWDRTSFDLNLSGNMSKRNEESEKTGNFINVLDESLNKIHNRDYDKLENNQMFSAHLNIRNKDFALANYISFDNSDKINYVKDLNGDDIIENINLSEKSNSKVLNYEPRLEYNKRLKFIYLNGRYYYGLNLRLQTAVQFYNYRNVSSLEKRNLTQNYQTFKPQVSLDYNYSKIGLYYSYYNLSYSYTENYPDLNSIAPIYDDINPGYRNFGAVGPLKKTGNHNFNFNGNYSQEKQYALRSNFSASYAIVQNRFVDSIAYVENQQQFYVIQQHEPLQRFNFNFTISKPYLVAKEQTLTFDINAQGSAGNTIQYTNNAKQEWRVKSLHANLNLYYTVLNKFQLGLKNELHLNQRKDKNSDNLTNNFNSTSWNTGISGAYSITKKLTLNSNFNNRSNFSNRVDNHFFIWNANATYRITKGNNLEVKVAAYDLLRQNKGFYFYNSNVEFTNGYRNILTQYYMVSLTYMPRQFGKKAKP